MKLLKWEDICYINNKVTKGKSTVRICYITEHKLSNLEMAKDIITGHYFENGNKRTAIVMAFWDEAFNGEYKLKCLCDMCENFEGQIELIIKMNQTALDLLELV